MFPAHFLPTVDVGKGSEEEEAVRLWTARSNIYAFGVVVALVASFFVLSACGSGDEADGAGAGVTPTVPAATPTSEPSATPGHTGIVAVDTAIDAVRAGDVDALREMFVYSPVPCVVSPEGLGAPPTCIDGEADGTPVDVISVAQCEGYYVRPDKADGIELPVQASTLYAVYGASDTLWPEGEYAVIFDRGESNFPQAWELILTDDGISGIHHGCAMSPERIVEFQQLTDAIVAPQQ